jgi:hypothetical protein
MSQKLIRSLQSQGRQDPSVNIRLKRILAGDVKSRFIHKILYNRSYISDFGFS